MGDFVQKETGKPGDLLPPNAKKKLQRLLCYSLAVTAMADLQAGKAMISCFMFQERKK